MATTTQTIHEDASVKVVREYDTVAQTETIREEPKVGSAGYNAEQIHAKLQQAVDYFGGNYDTWPTMTAEQKDAANRNAQRALAQLCRLTLGRFDSDGG